jgi:hypothetical protein
MEFVGKAEMRDAWLSEVLVLDYFTIDPGALWNGR